MSTTEPSAIHLSLRPWTAENKDAETLADQIRRVNAERGHFRNVTEESLRREIEAQEAGLVETTEEKQEDEEDKVHTREGLAAARRDLIRYVGQAYQEAAMALDFLSLLLSKDAPAQGIQSMSPALKDLVKPGTIHYEKWPSTTRTNAELRDEDIVTKGWKMQSLNDAADTLLKGAARLEQEVQRETKYWEQVLSLNRDGWAIRRVPQRKNVLGVQFGCGEAAPRFKARGFSALRSSDDGAITLDEEATQRPEAIRVRIRRGGKIVGTSQLAAIDSTAQAPIEELVRRARDTLFEQELYQEMLLEARHLAGYGIETRDGVILVPTRLSIHPSHSAASSNGNGDAGEILVDKVTLDSPSALERDEHSYDDSAQRIALALRLLLAHAHRHRLHARAQTPPPLADSTPKPPPTPLLRPLLSVLTHWADCTTLRTYLSSACAAQEAAGRPASFTLDDFGGVLTTLGAESTIDALGDSVTGVLESEAVVRIREREFRITLRTQLAQPVFGSTFSVRVDEGPLERVFGDWETFRGFMARALQLYS